MIGWRARLGFLVPPGNPTVEAEMIALAPEGVSLHFHRMVAHGTPGSLEGQSERNRTMVENIDSGIELLAMVKPEIIVVAHTATSYHLGRRGEADLLTRLEALTGRRAVTGLLRAELVSPVGLNVPPRGHRLCRVFALEDDDAHGDGRAVSVGHFAPDGVGAFAAARGEEDQHDPRQDTP